MIYFSYNDFMDCEQNGEINEIRKVGEDTNIIRDYKINLRLPLLKTYNVYKDRRKYTWKKRKKRIITILNKYYFQF